MEDNILININHPVLKNHKAYGRELMPGLAYIDMLYQFFQENGYNFSGLELRNLTIYNPLAAGPDYGIMLTIQCSEAGEGQWNITVEGQRYHNDRADYDKKLYITAQMHETVSAVSDKIPDLNAMKQSANKVVDLEKVYKHYRGQELIHTGIMKAEGSIYHTEEWILADICLNNRASATAAGTIFHPALIDGSAIASKVMYQDLLKQEQLFLPLFYESFRAWEPIREKCVALVKTSSVIRKKELVYVTIEFYSETGRKIGELRNLACKLVREPGLINTDKKAGSQSREYSGDSESFSTPDDTTLSGAEVEKFLRQLTARHLKKPLEQIDIHSGYYEMGLDSIGLLEIVKDMEREFGTALSPTLLFEYTTIAELSAYITEKNLPGYKRANVKNHPDYADYFSGFDQLKGDIAVIGMAGRYPGARNLREFWDNLKSGKDCISEIPKSRWDWQRFDTLRSPSGKKMSRWGGFLDEPDCFDPQFFRISPREAELMDPQERLFLETCWEAIEDAGYTPKTLVSPQGRNKRMKVGVFAGVMHKDYALTGAEAISDSKAFPLSLNYAQIANRVSYFCNFHGPSMAVDTVCSSSLTALHLALESIKKGECDTALAGGVNLSLHPDKYITYGMMGMHASDGHCHTFGKDGDGYVSAEGVGAVLLKPLNKAVSDGDHIYAVIKGSSINHVGAVSGITVPSPVAQAELIMECMEKTGIHPRTIGYIEAHGTGTSLGDPIEIQGLEKAFRQYTEDRKFCSIGSVKSNVGHAESAAGVCGLHKVILQLYHKTLVPSLHSEELNPYIGFEESPFYVQHCVEDWAQPMITENGCKVAYRRRAGVSSFGATGSNAHIILEEFVQEKAQCSLPLNQPVEEKVVIIPLSAKNKQRLYAYAGELLEFLKNHLFSSGFSEKTQGKAKKQESDTIYRGIRMDELAYTLQVGREAMEERVAFLSKNIPELVKMLEAFREDRAPDGNYMRGNARDNGESIACAAGEQKAAEIIKKCVRTGEMEKIAELWVSGFTMEWDLLYGTGKPCRISLPTYPFARERYWIPGNEADSTLADLNTYGHIHPLLHKNTSDIYEQKFSSFFSGSEFFLADHIINGNKVFPGAAHLEMARAAVEQSSDAFRENMPGVMFKNVVWVRPAVVEDQLLQVNIGLFAENKREIAYEIYGPENTIKGEREVYSQGMVVLLQAGEAPVMDLGGLRTQCSQGVFSSLQCYAAFKKIGIDYGPGHQGIERIYKGTGRLLARLSLPASVCDSGNKFLLHPSLLDSAFQAALMLDDVNPELALPYALQELYIFRGCSSEMWALVRHCSGSREDRIQKFDIDICDEEGRVCVRMRGLSVRAAAEGISSLKTIEPRGTLLLNHCWKQQGIAGNGEILDYKQHLVIICELNNISTNDIEKGIKEGRCLVLHSKEDAIEERFQAYAVSAFEEIRDMLGSKSEGKILVQIVVPSQGEKQLFSGLLGLVKTARLENPKLLGQIIEVEEGENFRELIEKLICNSRYPNDSHVRYQSGERYVGGWSEIEGSQADAAVPWKDGGIYLITGGAGGLGLIFAKEIAGKTQNAVVILAGRSPLSKEKSVQLKELEGNGIRIEYRQADVSCKADTASLLEYIGTEFGGLNGIIHSAGVISDNYIVKKGKEEFLQVLAPKVAGLVNLDQESSGLPLDFFILFSSVAGCLGNPGQADYSTANAFMDAYAVYRNALAALKKRRGSTISINWPLWKEGGMHVDSETEKMMMQSMGMAAIETHTAVKAFYKGIASGKDRVLVMYGNLQRMKQKLLSTMDYVSQKGRGQSGEDDFLACGETYSLPEKVQSVLRHSVSELLKIKMEDIDISSEFSEYGFDSITFTEFANKLNEEYKLELTPAIFFEHSTIKSLARFFSEEYKSAFAGLISDKRGRKTPVFSEENSFDKEPSFSIRGSRISKVREMARLSQNSSADEPIAIIGVSGVFPMAKDINELWKNLLEGKDCITEIPKSRWDWREYYGDPIKEVNKSNIKWGGFIESVDEFDPLFFGISPREAELMDPQQRLLMTYAWKVIEDAGYSARSISGTRTGIFVGTASSGYNSLISRANKAIEGYSATGAVPSVGPNRMSYFLNIHGPSEPVETACSSSLVAIHRAVSAIKEDTCEMAIAGGVNTIITPEVHISFNKAGMLSEDGRCKTFSSKADGYVRGEGAGMVLLKKLSAAEAAGDHIYAVIRSTAENHGGRANSLTSPNPKAQTELLVEAYTKAGIDPRTVGYIEAHGTGTELGDPIEVNALKAAFKKLYQDTGNQEIMAAHCGLGSVKTNIGHLELAAGIAGVIKVVLQIKNKMLVKSLHCDSINPYIKLDNSPFYIVNKCKEWNPLQDEEGKDIPRRAGVSSFGFGGSNAHVVIEEYVPREAEQTLIEVSTQNPAVIVLSAKNAERLTEQAQQLLTAIRENEYPDTVLADMAYTLQVGRDAMEERLALLAGSVKELEEKIEGFLAGREMTAGMYRGQVKRNKDAMAVFAEDEELQEAIEKWIARRKYAKLLGLWVKGMDFDWGRLYGSSRVRRMSLPAYPLAKEHYWVLSEGIKHFGSSEQVQDLKEAVIPVLHPLLHRNTSDFSQQCFSSTFTGQEFFLSDHVVRGKRILPGAAYLEMARKAVELSSGTMEANRMEVQLKNILWISPISVENQPVQVHIRLSPEDEGEIAFEIYTNSGVPEVGNIAHSRGSALLKRVGRRPGLDLAALKAQFNQSSITSGQCYETFKAAGIEYGPGHRGIEKIFTGAGQILAKLSLPPSVADTHERYVMHPSLLDSAFQASIALITDFAALIHADGMALTEPALLFELSEVEIFDECTHVMWAFIRISGEKPQNNQIQKLDIDLCDEKGDIRIRMRGASIRTMGAEGTTKRVLQQPSQYNPEDTMTGTVLLTPAWDPVHMERSQVCFPPPNDNIVLICDDEDKITSIRQYYPKSEVLKLQIGDTSEDIMLKLKQLDPIEHIIWIAPYQTISSLADEDIIKAQDEGVLQVYRIVKALLTLGYGNSDLSWSFITIQAQPVHKNDTANPSHACIHGFAGSLAREYRNWKIRIIDMEAAGNWPVGDMFTLPADTGGELLVYRCKEWYRQQLLPFNSLTAGQTAYRAGGVYVVIGGAGGIGEAWSEYMIRTYKAHIIWIGRRKKDAVIQAKLDRFAGFDGPAPVYVSADAADDKSLLEAHEKIKAKYAQIHGVVHSAMIMMGKSLETMEEGDFRASLSAKVDVSVRIARVFSKDPLDFIVFFSSINSFIKASGQSNYSSGCTFTDAFAYRLSREWTCSVKVMNWGYWGSVGHIAASKEFKHWMENKGIGSIEPPEAMAALEMLLAGPVDQIALVKATKPSGFEGIKPAGELVVAYPEEFRLDIRDMQKDTQAGSDTISSSGLLEKIQTVLIDTVAELIAVNKEYIDAATGVSEYGFDAAMLAGLIEMLNRKFNLELTSSILTKDHSLYNAAEYLMKEYGDVLAETFEQAGFLQGGCEKCIGSEDLKSSVAFTSDRVNQEGKPDSGCIVTEGGDL
ncbi:MAG: SDR family NAD(P)-dependent oxidoreductase [Clostridia bacterium]|nr:SDR family NAD(P)-dependent oxidoreductase [Clostridia bacterium]